MPHRATILIFSVVLMQGLPAASLGVPGWTVGNSNGVGNAGNVMLGDNPDDDNGGSWGSGHGGWDDGGHHDWDHDYYPTATVSHCSRGDRTVTVTDTIIESSAECTATSTDILTITVDGPTETITSTTAGPTVTSTVTTGAETVTADGSTTTETVHDTSTITTTDFSTLTDFEVLTSTQTVTKTDTLEVTTTVTSDSCTPTDGGNTIDYGTCSDPTILYEYGLDGRTDYSYTTRNQADFPFGSDPSIFSPEDLVCNRLKSPCNAPQATIDLCYEAEDATKNLSGQEAADVWNSIMT